MRRDSAMMVQLARQAADPGFGHHLLLLRDAGYLDEWLQLTETGKAFVAGAGASGMEKLLTMEGLIETLNRAERRGFRIEIVR